jgi:hypothetical protein
MKEIAEFLREQARFIEDAIGEPVLSDSYGEARLRGDMIRVAGRLQGAAAVLDADLAA